MSASPTRPALLACSVISALSPFSAVNTYERTRPTPTPTLTVTPGRWEQVELAPPELPTLPGLPSPTLGSADPQQGPVAFTPISCPGPQARIESITASGVWWHIAGTAALADDFRYWKTELSADGSGWTLLYRSESPVNGGRLMEFNTTTVPPGSYQLRLTVVDRTGNYPTPCTVRIISVNLACFRHRTEILAICKIEQPKLVI